MPKIIDHDARRVLIAEAAWRLVARDGVAGLSVRTVAAEAGLATASLRTSFPTQRELLAFCFEQVLVRAEGRLRRLLSEPDARKRTERMLAEALPLDEERRIEMEVWLAFGAVAFADESLREIYERGFTGLRTLCRGCVGELSTLAPAAADDAAERLHAFLDGLALHLVARPGVTSATRAQRLLRQELDALTD